jgi:hypothetical protein
VAVFINAKKAGTTTVSYKVGSDTYTAKITVKKYTCPFASLNLGKILPLFLMHIIIKRG